jgi:hypothetical protein
MSLLYKLTFGLPGANPPSTDESVQALVNGIQGSGDLPLAGSRQQLSVRGSGPSSWDYMQLGWQGDHSVKSPITRRDPIPLHPRVVRCMLSVVPEGALLSGGEALASLQFSRVNEAAVHARILARVLSGLPPSPDLREFGKTGYIFTFFEEGVPRKAPVKDVLGVGLVRDPNSQDSLSALVLMEGESQIRGIEPLRAGDVP